MDAHGHVDPWSAIDAAEISTDDEERSTLLEATIDHLTAHGDHTSADVEQAIAYAWYLLPPGTVGRDDQVQTHLANTLRIDPQHQYARLYLAHHDFDRGHYATALESRCAYRCAGSANSSSGRIR